MLMPDGAGDEVDVEAELADEPVRIERPVFAGHPAPVPDSGTHLPPGNDENGEELLAFREK